MTTFRLTSTVDKGGGRPLPRPGAPPLNLKSVLHQDTLMDWALLKESFQTEVDKLSKFRHSTIVELLGFSEGGGAVCLIFSYMENRFLEDQLHN
ncbi:LOW QUALITY PROTEIN: interleukin-1 receptor-associated kinase 1-like, partial [Trematomus bernacchii]|uniref:LOW QUALITY PROTEIN: interleukin-1 receptor-associated kinase 1-like n=1 Tax=Trematomus bernacchii TaxID=40690 RepID=UPI00146AA532